VGARWNICGRRKRRALRPGRYRNILAGDVISDLGECGASVPVAYRGIEPRRLSSD